MSLLHGVAGLATAYAAVQAPMLMGLARARAQVDQYFASPFVAAPLLLAAAAGSSLFAHGVARELIMLGLAAGLGYAGGHAMVRGRAIRDNNHKRGSLVEERSEAPGPTARPAARGTQRSITVAGREVPVHDEAKHFKLIGTTGTGKSTAIREILSRALEREDRAVIADPDGGYLNRFYDARRGDVILNPFDARSVKWDLFAEVQNGYDVEQLARSLIPDHDGHDRSWRAYARTFFVAVTRQAHEAGIRDVGELYRLLVVADAGELRGLVRGTPAQPFLDEANSRMFDSVRSVASSAVAGLEYVAQQRADNFSVRRWVSERSPGVLFMPYKAGQIAALRSTISAWMRLAIFETMNGEERTPATGSGGRLWFVVDELDALGQIDGLKDALARLRKFDGRCVLGFQSIAQVSSTYGAGDAHTIVENCGNTLILRCSASEGGGTARFASQLIGDREVMRTSVSHSRRPSEWLSTVSHSQHLAMESAVLASQVEQLPDLTGYLKYASQPTWQRVELKLQQDFREHE